MDDTVTKFSLSKKYLASFSSLEIGFIVQCIVCIIISKYVGILAIPLAMAMSASIFFAFVFSFIVFVMLFVKDGKKQKIMMPIFKYVLNQCCPIQVSGIQIDEITSDCIIICNYPAAFVEYLIMPMLLDEQNMYPVITISAVAMCWARPFIDSENVIKLSTTNNFDYLMSQLKEKCDMGKVPVIYPEKNFSARPTRDSIQPFRSGIFKIAERLKKKIVLARVQHIEHICGFITNNNLKVKLEYCKSYDPKKAREQMILM